MTTTVLVHNGHRKVRVTTEDHVTLPPLQDGEGRESDHEWREAYVIDVEPGQLFQTYCTDTRRLTIVEPEI